MSLSSPSREAKSLTLPSKNSYHIPILEKKKEILLNLWM